MTNSIHPVLTVAHVVENDDFVQIDWRHLHADQTSR